MLHSLPTHTPSPNTPYPAHMGYQNSSYILDPSIDSAAVDFRAFYPYTPNEVKHRKRTTSAQLKVLETVFKKDTKPNANLRNELASELDMSARGVQVWFQNRRAKEKLKAGKSPGSKGGPGSTSPSSSKQELCAIKDEMISPDSLITSPDSSDHFDASPSPSITSPPQLHLITDPSNFCWDNSPVEPPDSATFITRPNILPGTNDIYSYRRGSLPVNAFPPEPSSESPQPDCFDPLVRRRSIDASLQRLASNPFAGLARAKNSALYGPGFGVSPAGRHHQLGHLPYGIPPQRRGLSQLSAMPQHANLRRLSMDSRSTRIPSKLNQSPPSPSPLTPYNAVVRASLPDHLFTVTSRTVVSPIPGPLPSPGFSFGAASTPSTTSPSSGNSERNSPDSLQSFTFRSEDNDEDGVPSHYEVYSRFGSVASIATSDSSINSSYFSDHLATPDVRAEDRRSSCSSGQFLGLMSGLDVNGQIEHAQQNSLNLASYSPHEDYSYVRGNEGVELINSREIHRHQQQQQAEGSYPSPASTISPHGTPHSRDPAVPISTSSELAFALESKPSDQTPGSRQGSYMAYGDHHHQNHLPAAATVTSHAHAHGVVDQNVTDHDEADYYTQQHQHETDGTQSADTTSLYQQETGCNVLNSHGHYIASSYSSLSDAYPGSTDHQMDYTHCVGGGVVATYPPSAYGETLSSVLGHGASGLNGVIQPVDAFASYST